MKPKVWITGAGRVYDINHAARLIGTTAAKLRAMVDCGILADAGGERESVWENDVLRLRAERGRAQIEAQRRSTIRSASSKLINVGRPETLLRERPGNQAVLDWSRFSNPQKPTRE